jgi:hypothetical protein
MEWPRHISIEQAYFYGAGLFPRNRPISTEQAYFHRAGLFLRSRPISMEQAYFYGAGLFPQSRGPFHLISTPPVDEVSDFRPPRKNFFSSPPPKITAVLENPSENSNIF